MTSHAHMIIGTEKDDMQDIVRDMKRHTSVALRKAIKEPPQESRREWMLKLMENAGLTIATIPASNFGDKTIILLNCLHKQLHIKN